MLTKWGLTIPGPPAMKVLARLRMVGKRLSISGLKTQQSHSMYCFPFPGR